MQVEGCAHIQEDFWAAVSSALTGPSWHGGLSVFKSGPTSFEPQQQWFNDAGGVTCITVRRGDDNHLIVTGSTNGRIYIHPFSNGFVPGKVSQINAHQAPISGISFSPTSSQLATTSWDNKINLYSMDGNSPQFVTSVLAHYKRINTLAWHSENSFISGGSDKDIKLWETRENSIGEAARRLSKPKIEIHTTQSCFSLTCKEELVAVGQENCITLYDLRNPSLALNTLGGFKGPVKVVSFHPHSNLLALGSDDGRTQVVDTKNNQVLLYVELGKCQV
eukprot:TRINITY_DN1441_c0_g4_i3.p1 TRINITY_DN1441_c0_g4~~TRINITY_DN1441_c0_g4_i3.p1  ORF type:complete len:277 (+),score=40.24 TRINITY_DN1441_c0_g4_i3:60-890(+)